MRKGQGSGSGLKDINGFAKYELGGRTTLKP